MINRPRFGPCAPTTFLCCTRHLICFGVATAVFVDDILTHVEQLSVRTKAHFDSRAKELVKWEL